MSKNPARGKPNRSAKFKAALALAGITVDRFVAQSDIDVTPAHLYAVLRGDRESASLIEKVDAFIAKYLPEHTQAAV
jgi:hypothetical protein